MTQHQTVDNLVQGFQDDLEVIVAKARRATIAYLTDNLLIVDGLITRTKSNQRLLRKVAARFQREMRRAGYNDLVDTFVGEFNGQFAFFDDVLAKLGADIGKDLQVKFGTRDVDFFASQQLSSIHVLEDVVVTVAADAQRQALMSVGALKLSDLISEVADQFQKSIPEATTLADTAVSVFYRTIATRGYEIVSKSLPKSIEMRFKYLGPDDRVTRPFCHKLCAQNAKGQTWARAEIDAMDNGQIPNVFTSGGGFLCRHSWEAVFDHGL